MILRREKQGTRARIQLRVKTLQKYDLSIVGLMHDEFWTLPIANMMYIRLQIYTNMMIDEHGVQKFEDVVVVLL
jgi:hypothetical protein